MPGERARNICRRHSNVNQRKSLIGTRAAQRGATQRACNKPTGVRISPESLRLNQTQKRAMERAVTR